MFPCLSPKPKLKTVTTLARGWILSTSNVCSQLISPPPPQFFKTLENTIFLISDSNPISHNPSQHSAAKLNQNRASKDNYHFKCSFYPDCWLQLSQKLYWQRFIRLYSETENAGNFQQFRQLLWKKEEVNVSGQDSSSNLKYRNLKYFSFCTCRPTCWVFLHFLNGTYFKCDPIL